MIWNNFPIVTLMIGFWVINLRCKFDQTMQCKGINEYSRYVIVGWIPNDPFFIVNLSCDSLKAHSN